MAAIKNIIGLAKGVWVVSYEQAAPCGCFFERKTVVIRQKTKPSEKTIQKAITTQNETNNQ